MHIPKYHYNQSDQLFPKTPLMNAERTTLTQMVRSLVMLLIQAFNDESINYNDLY